MRTFVRAYGPETMLKNLKKGYIHIKKIYIDIIVEKTHQVWCVCPIDGCIDCI